MKSIVVDMLLTLDDFHDYQWRMERWIISMRNCALWADPGLGKTVATLTALKTLRRNFEIRRPLVVAPLLVSQTVWPDEINKWEHLQGMSCKNLYWPDTEENNYAYSMIAREGLDTQEWKSIADPKKAEQQRISVLKKRDAIIAKYYRQWLKESLSNQSVSFYTMNREQVALLARVTYQDWPFDMVVLDEASSFKNSSSLRWKALKAIRSRINRLVELTGSPASRGLLDVWAQIWLLDQGEALGRSFTSYKQQFFNKSFDGYNWEIRDGAKEQIYERIKPLCVTLLEKDYLSLPRLVPVEHPLSLPPKAQKKYDELERDYFTSVDDETVAASHSASLHNKLRQVCNGAVYTDGTIEDPESPHQRLVKTKGPKNWKVIHNEKLECVRGIVEEASGQPVLIGFHFKHDGWRLEKEFPEAQRLDTPEKIAAWQRGDIAIGIGHPASMGHGLNLQSGGHILIWFGWPWSLELYDQFWKRLRRQGQTEPVIMHFVFIDCKTERAMQQCLTMRKATEDDLKEAMKKA